MPQSLANILIHVVFSTKLRVQSITPALRSRLDPYMAGIASNIRCPAIQLGGVADHSHGLFVLHPTVAVAELIGTLKSNTSKWIHETFPEHAAFGWQAGYGAFSVSVAARDSVARYIVNQEEHHRDKTFQDEFLAFLEAHGMPYDPRYIWD